jgi:hypothetical protein
MVAVQWIDGAEIHFSSGGAVFHCGQDSDAAAKQNTGGGSGQHSAGFKQPIEATFGPAQFIMAGGDAVPDFTVEAGVFGCGDFPLCEYFIKRVCGFHTEKGAAAGNRLPVDL